MGFSNHQELAEAWVKLMRLDDENSENSPLFEAFSLLDDLVYDKPEEAWQVMQLLWKIDSSDEMLSIIAAGPVEDLLSLHGEAFIGRFEELSITDAIFKKLLGAVWGQDRMPPAIYARLKAIAGETF